MRWLLSVVFLVGLVSASGAETETPDEAELVRLRAENKVLRATIRRLSNELDTLRAKIKWFTGVSPLPSPAKASAGPDAAIQELIRQDEELKDTIKALQMRVNLGRAKVSKLTRAKVDVDVIHPPGYLGGDYWRERGGKRGDFRTEHDRTMAVQAAKEELLPLEVKLTSLKKQQAKLRDELAKARAASAGRAPSPPPGAAPSPPEAVPSAGAKRSEVIAEAAEIPLPRILAETNQRIKALTDDQELTSAQRSAAIEKEVATLRRIVKSRAWIMACEVIDISKVRDSVRSYEVGKAADSGDWNIVLRIPDLGGTVATVRMSMRESKALTLKKGQQLHMQCELRLDRSLGEPFGLGLSVKSASIYEGQLPAAGAAAGAEVTFLGIKAKVAKKIVYIVDRSGSMTDSINYVKYELKRSISELGEDTAFHVIFYSSGPPVEMPTRRLVAGTDRNKQLAFEFVDGIIPQGETDPSKALERAFAVGPELIYLLTDGEFDKAIIGLVKRLNVGNKVTVHTIGFLYRTGDEVLKTIAEQNNGNYKFVSEADLATLVQ